MEFVIPTEREIYTFVCGVVFGFSVRCLVGRIGRVR